MAESIIVWGKQNDYSKVYYHAMTEICCLILSSKLFLKRSISSSLGLPKDKKLALELYQKSAKNGNKNAQDRLEEILKGK